MAGGECLGGSRTGAGSTGPRGSSMAGGTPCGFCGVGGNGVRRHGIGSGGSSDRRATQSRFGAIPGKRHAVMRSAPRGRAPCPAAPPSSPPFPTPSAHVLFAASRPLDFLASTLAHAPARLLRGTFGLKHLREGQAAVIDHVMAGEPTLAVMPTGAGKSLCYQLPALLLPGVTLVVSPLIALMKDQSTSCASSASTPSS